MTDDRSFYIALGMIIALIIAFAFFSGLVVGKGEVCG